MSREDKIKEIQERIYKLSVEVNSSLHQLRILQAQLDDLRRVTVKEINEKPIGSQNKNITIHPSVSIPESLSIENFIGLKLKRLASVLLTSITLIKLLLFDS